MATKKYSSYEQIELELEILKIERELNLNRIVLSVQKTKESFMPVNLLKGFIGDFKSILSNNVGTVFNFAIPIFINWILNKKRGK